MNTIQLSKIRTNGGTQSRASIHDDTVADYADAIRDGADFPAVVLFFDGSDYWLADGFHRHAAYASAGKAEIPAEVHQGSRREAILHSVGANAKHGLRRTNDDKRRAVMTLLNDPEWSEWSNREIARQCGVSDVFVGKMRKPVTANVSSEVPRTYTTKHGTTAEMNTSNIGKAQPAGEAQEQEPEQPAAPVRQPEVSEAKPEDAARQPEDPETQPEPDPNAEARKSLSGLTREGLEDEVLGLREENAELRQRVASQRSEIADLKGQVKELTSDEDTGRKIGNLQRRLTQSEGRSKEHQTNAARLQRQVNAQKAEIEKLNKRLENQVIPL